MSDQASSGSGSGTSKTTMRAAVLAGVGKIEVVDKPIPRAADDGVVVKVSQTCLCGSDLHYYTGHLNVGTGFTMGHEFTGVVSEVGKDVRGLVVGDKVVSPFTVCCMACFYCEIGLTCRCEKGKVYGSPVLEGAQAEYVHVPLADTTLFKAPSDVPDETLILMADIFPTGYYAATRGLGQLLPAERNRDDLTIAIIGAGPVGLCAATSAKHFNPAQLFIIDLVEDRLARAASHHGATPINLNDDPKAKILAATGGRGADVVLEVVGRADALQLAFDIARNGGVIQSVGIHGEPLPLHGNACYNKNIRLAFGRCPVRAIFADALDVLQQHHKDFDGFVDGKMSLEDAPKAYELFAARKIQKTVFIP
ncbi:hypothetical protein PYCC9005_004898 [Savitreella phatthalungensis]